MKPSLNNLVLAFVLVLAALILLSAFGAIGNLWGADVRMTPWGWHVVTIVLIAAVGVAIFGIARGIIEANGGSFILIAVLLILACCSSTGFKFTAGDIKQRETYVNLDGKITDKARLIEAYGGYYHLDTDTATMRYILTYDELPGVNHWAYNILQGKTAPSTSPRANEDYKWHTGAYDASARMPIK